MFLCEYGKRYSVCEVLYLKITQLVSWWLGECEKMTKLQPQEITESYSLYDV